MKILKISYALSSLMLSVLLFNVWPCFCNFTSFIFGDSLVDSGNNDYILTLSKADYSPYGIDFKPSGGQPTGRFTNGRTTSDIIGQVLGAKSFPQPYLSPNALSYLISEGVNYASGASGILDETGTSFIGRIPLGMQVNFFEKSRSYIASLMGVDRVENLLKKSVFSITTGSNDVLNYYFQPTFAEKNEVSPATFQDFMISNLTVQLKRLHGKGGRKFLIVGVGPLGCIPFVRALHVVPRKKCSVQVNDFIQGYNKKLTALVDRLNQELGPQTIFVYANSYDIVLGVIKNYRRYGFENAEDPCCGGYFPPYTCFNNIGTNANASSVVCDNRSKYVFWDAYHPTEATNLIIAQKLLNGGQSVMSPINIHQLYSYTY